jgi:AP2-associated kinase
MIHLMHLLQIFDNHKFITGTTVFGQEHLQVEVDRLKEELEQVRLEKAEITLKYEKLTAICRSQRQEIQELKQILSTATAQNFTTFSKEGSAKPVVSQQTQVH